MSISVLCTRCLVHLDQPGALVFSPPGDIGTHVVEKFHVCVECWPKVRDSIMPT